MLWNQFSNEAKLAETIPSLKRLIRHRSVCLDKMYFLIVTAVYFYFIVIIILIHTTSKCNFSISLMISSTVSVCEQVLHGNQSSALGARVILF